LACKRSNYDKFYYSDSKENNENTVLTNVIHILTLLLPGGFPWQYPQLPSGFSRKFKSQKVDTARRFPSVG